MLPKLLQIGIDYDCEFMNEQGDVFGMLKRNLGFGECCAASCSNAKESETETAIGAVHVAG